jgi:hypothetical protein
MSSQRKSAGEDSVALKYNSIQVETTSLRNNESGENAMSVKDIYHDTVKVRLSKTFAGYLLHPPVFRGFLDSISQYKPNTSRSVILIIDK